MTCDRSIFESQEADCKELLITLKNKSSRLSLLRLLSFVLFVVSICVAANKHSSVLFLLSFILLALFVIAVYKHNAVNQLIKYNKALLSVNQQYIARIDCNFDLLDDSGIEFDVTNHDYSADLDIFGKSSLFSRFNVSDNYIGRQVLADKLLNSHSKHYDFDNSNAIHDSVKELMNKPDFMRAYQSTSRIGNLQKKPEAIMSLSGTEINYSKVDKFILSSQVFLWFLPLISSLVAPTWSTAAVFGVIIINLFAWFFVASKYNAVFAKSSGISKQANTLSQLYKLIDDEIFDSSYLNELVGKKKETYNSLSRLNSALTLTGFRSQPLLALLLNCVVPFDYWCSLRISKWIANDSTDINKAIKNLGELESLMSASCVGLVSDCSVFPDIVDSCEFYGEDIRHPLINPQEVVSNSIQLKSQTAIITGSNMSGKTTLIRTVGVISVLAYIGAPVPATKVRLGHMRIVSSMRIVDSLENNISTFRAELIKIAHIVDAAKKNTNLMFLIDEIFRGTNSADRTDGAFVVLNKLAKPHILGMMTTHDYALCDKVKDTMQNIVYYHFSEKYNDNDIIFDYKLKDGVSNESNVKYLMRLVGITD